jgi:hypothetical protein
MTSLTDGCRYVVAGQNPQEEVGADHQGLIEDDGAASGDGTDDHTEDDPLLEIGGGGHPTARTS